jgi:hypothetical protein
MVNVYKINLYSKRVRSLHSSLNYPTNWGEIAVLISSLRMWIYQSRIWIKTISWNFYCFKMYKNLIDLLNFNAWLLDNVFIHSSTILKPIRVFANDLVMKLHISSRFYWSVVFTLFSFYNVFCAISFCRAC